MALRRDLENKKYSNWVRAGLGLKFVKEGLEPFCDHLVNQQHGAILENVKQKHKLSTVSCGDCDVGTLQPDHVRTRTRLCPLGQIRCNCLRPDGKTSCLRNEKNVCGAIYDEIIKLHASIAPNWKNTDARQWCTEPWAVAKCFINASGYEHKIRAVEFDCSGLLHLFINNTDFRHHIQCNISGNDAFSKVHQHRNAIFHSNNMELEDTDITNMLDDMIELLQDKKKIKGKQESKEAVKKLLELKKNQLIITAVDEKEVIGSSIAAIKELRSDNEGKEKGRSFPGAPKHKEAGKKSDSSENKGTDKNPGLKAEEQAYNRLREHLKRGLIDLYRKRQDTQPLSPLIEEDETPLKFYFMPEIDSVEIQRSRGGGKEVRSKVTSLHDVFYNKNELCHKIYLTADAGFGKTALSKRLALTWCQAKNCIQHEDEYFKKENISTMSNFDFVFLLSLRDCSEEWDIDEMIEKQIIHDLPYTSVSKSDLEAILSKERCLIILDGLDEWTNTAPACKQRKSDIPSRKVRRKCTILTTTRPWKLGVSKIRSSEIERKLELIGLSKTSAKRLKRTVISLLCGETDIEKHIQDFDRAISDRGILDLETFPLLLMYLLCLWCDGIELGASRTELYCQIVELLLKQTFEKYPGMQQSREPSQTDIPQYFSEHERCNQYYIYLKALGKLAFETLFCETKERTLAFNKSVADKYLSPNYLKLSFASGILSTETTPIKQISKVSFSHKTMHDFFCALYISCQNENDILTIVLNKCKSLQCILDMSTVFVFISGMVNTEIISLISRNFKSVISEDKRTSEYRTTTDGYCEPLKDIQDMYISCMKENTSVKELKLCCQDFFFSEDCEEEKYFTHLTRLAVHNKNNMVSININIVRGRSLREIIDSCALYELFQINKIYYEGRGEQNLLPVLLNKSSKCVTVISFCDSWSREMLETLRNNSLLQAICISWLAMSHDVLNDFLNDIINRKTMTEIVLLDLSCTEHERSCIFSLDFCQHSDLRKLELGWIPEVSQLKVNSQVKHVELGGINLGEMSLPPEMGNIELFEFFDVNMSALTLRDLVKVVEKLSHKVTVKIGRCEIEPETEFEHVKQYIHSSQNFRATSDGRWVFVFETKDQS